MSVFVPRTRFGMDNVKIGWDVPYEDEFAIVTMTCLSPYVSMAFPRRQSHYDQYLTLRDVSLVEINQWKETLMTFLRKLTWKYQRPLVLKSPGHTCRIKLLLELFPEAKFIHIRRNPFLVFHSMQKMLSVALRFWRLQHADSIDWRERAIRQYSEMHDVFFEQRPLIPDGQFHELSFEDLETDPIGQLRQAYEALKLPRFDSFEPTLRQYLETLMGYQKNVFAELSNDTCKRLTTQWGACFEAWGYPTDQAYSGQAPRSLVGE